MTRIYRGIARKERTGWIAGLSAAQACTVAALAVPVVWALSAGAWRNALVLAGVCGVLALLVIVPVRGRPAARWLAHWVLYQVGVLTGWSRWQSRAAAGMPVNPTEPDLPGVLTRMTFPDGPPYREGGRVCLVHDTAEGRWGATARLTHGGVGLISSETRELLARRLGTMLRSSGAHGIVDRLSIYVRSVPDDGTEYAVWRQRHQAADAPQLAIEATDELSRTVGAVSVRHEVFVTVSGTESALHKPASHAGGGIAGRAAVLYRALDGLEEPLKSLGVHSIQWADSRDRRNGDWVHDVRARLKTSACVRHPRILRGLWLSRSSTACRSAGVWTDRSVRLGKYCRSRPFVFSLVPRCHGLPG